MKRALSLWFVFVCSAGVCLAQLAPAHPAPATGSRLPWETNVFAPAPRSAPPLVVPLAPLFPRTNLYLRSQTNSLGLPFYSLPGQPTLRSEGRAQANRLLAQTQPAPGLYKSEPYTCLVLVPGPHPDDKALVPAAPVSPRMPQTAPEFRLVPRSTPAAPQPSLSK